MEFGSFAIKSSFSSTLSEDNTLIYISVILIFLTINPPFYSKIIFLVTDKYRIAEYLQHSLWENLYLSAHHNDGR